MSVPLDRDHLIGEVVGNGLYCMFSLVVLYRNIDLHRASEWSSGEVKF